MTFVAIPQQITGPYISVCLSKWNNQAPKHRLLKDKDPWSQIYLCAIKQNSET